MASGRGRRLPRFLILLIVSACANSPGQAATSVTTGLTAATTPSTTVATTIPTTSTSTSTPATTASPTSVVPVTPEGIDATIRIPEGDGPFPAVVLIHGGGWVGGSPGGMEGLARFLTNEGFLTFNVSYRLATEGAPGFPGAVDDIACAIRSASAHPDSDGSVAVIGHSAGAHLAALAALTGDSYGAECLATGSGLPARFVGLGGPYDISRLGILMIPFFGVGPATDPDAWEAGNPQLHTDANPELVSLIMYGGRDGIVEDSFSIDFHNALIDSGTDSSLELVEDASHLDLIDPSVVGDLIVTWLQR